VAALSVTIVLVFDKWLHSNPGTQEIHFGLSFPKEVVCAEMTCREYKLPKKGVNMGFLFIVPTNGPKKYNH